MFNHHRLKKQFSRGVKQASFFGRISNKCSTKDFAWHNSKDNPLLHSSSSNNVRRKIEVCLLATTSFLILIILLFHPFFTISELSAQGYQRIKQKDFEDKIFSILNGKRFFIFQSGNYFLVNLDELRDIIKSVYPIKSIYIKKVFPNTLEIKVEEKISTIIYDNGREYCYLGTSGNPTEILRKVGDNEWFATDPTLIVTSTPILTTSASNTLLTTASTTTSTTTLIIENKIHRPDVTGVLSSFGDYPILYDTRNQDIIMDHQLLSQTNVQGVIDWYNKLKNESNIPVKYFTISNDLGTVVIETGEKWQLKVRLQDVDKQFEELIYILKTKIRRPNLKYIDLRFKGAVYWQ